MYDKKKLEKLQKQQEKWEKADLQKYLSQSPERKDVFITTSSEPIERVYTPLDIKDLDYEKDLGMPGEYPYTRGIHPTLHRGKLWTIRRLSGFNTPEETNRLYREEYELQEQPSTYLLLTGAKGSY